jgi:dCTP diphosphatase
MDIKIMQKQIVKFRDDRDWKQFHNPKDLALSLNLEASEVLEHFQWKNGKELKNYLEKHKVDLSDEIADVFKYLLLLANETDIDLSRAFKNKMKKDNINYPVEKVKGKHKKYNEY